MATVLKDVPFVNCYPLVAVPEILIDYFKIVKPRVYNGAIILFWSFS